MSTPNHDDRLREVIEYLVETAPEYFTKESGLRRELQSTARSGYDTALEHIAYAMGLPASVHQIADEDVPVCKRIRARFPQRAH